MYTIAWFTNRFNARVNIFDKKMRFCNLYKYPWYLRIFPFFFLREAITVFAIIPDFSILSKNNAAISSAVSDIRRFKFASMYYNRCSIMYSADTCMRVSNKFMHRALHARAGHTSRFGNLIHPSMTYNKISITLWFSIKTLSSNAFDKCKHWYGALAKRK